MIRIIAISLMLSSCGSLYVKTAVIASAARIVEARRDAEAFDDPTASRSIEWHADKFAQYGLWAYYGHIVLSDTTKSLPEKAVVTAVSLGVAWVAFEVSLRGFRN